MAYHGRHPNLYDNLSPEEAKQLEIVDHLLHRKNENASGVQVVLQDDSSSSDDEADEKDALMESAGLLFKRPVILQEGLRDEFQGRQVVNRLFDIMDRNKQIDIEEANRPPPEYYWTPGMQDKYNDLSAWGKIKHNMHWVGYKTFWGIAFVGEVAINVLGLDQPEYSWMLDEAEKDRKKLEDKKRFQAQRRAYLLEKKLAEEGLLDASDNDNSDSDTDAAAAADNTSGGSKSRRVGGLRRV